MIGPQYIKWQKTDDDDVIGQEKFIQNRQNYMSVRRLYIQELHQLYTFLLIHNFAQRMGIFHISYFTTISFYGR